MEWLYDLGRFFSTNVGVILTFAGGIVAGYFALRTKQSGDSIEAAKVAIDGRKLDADERAKMEARFDRFMERLEKEREEARKENESMRGHIQALTERTVEQTRHIGKLEAKIDAMRVYIGQLVTAMRADGKEPPTAPEQF